MSAGHNATAPATRAVLVTGGAGFIGSHLVEALLQRGDRVTVVDTALASPESKNLAGAAGRFAGHAINLEEDDLRPLLADERPAVVFHLAGYTIIPGSVENPRQDFENNALATLNVLDAIRDVAPDATLIFTSSAAVYGEGTDAPLREEGPTLPIAPYGVSKLAAERYVDVYARVYGLRTASLRLFPAFGPRLRKHVVYDLMRKVRDSSGELFIHGDGRQVRDFVYIANVVDALLLVADRAPLHGEVYNVGGDEPTSIEALARMICERMGASPRFVYSGDVAAGVSLRWVADSTRLKKLGYRPRIRLAEGLTETVAWFRRAEGGDSRSSSESTRAGVR